ncbi:MAG: macrocin O-methyltransferase, partial [Terriglobia bacterium]
GSSMAMALSLMAHNERSRTIWLYDTFEGMTEPTEADRIHSGASASALLQAAREYERKESSRVIAYASLEDVKANLARTGYPLQRHIKGPVETTIPLTVPERVALLRLDTDWYESTRHELEHLYPRLVPGGILIIDDYGWWQGARKAVDEYFAGQAVYLHRIDTTGRLLVKPCC